MLMEIELGNFISSLLSGRSRVICGYTDRQTD